MNTLVLVQSRYLRYFWSSAKVSLLRNILTEISDTDCHFLFIRWDYISRNVGQFLPCRTQECDVVPAMRSPSIFNTLLQERTDMSTLSVQMQYIKKMICGFVPMVGDASEKSLPPFHLASHCSFTLSNYIQMKNPLLFNLTISFELQRRSFCLGKSWKHIYCKIHVTFTYITISHHWASL